MENDIKNGDLTQLKKMQLRAAELANEIDQASEDSHAFSREFGQGGRMPAGERLELGRRLARNKKLGELARMVGRFKQDARGFAATPSIVASPKLTTSSAAPTWAA